MFFPRPRPGFPVAPVNQQVMPPRIHPTQHNVVNKCCEYIVPEVHPSHTTVVQNHLYKHMHSFPHTQSVVNQVSNQHFVCPPGSGCGLPGVAPRRRFF